ncbi:MAG: TIGR04283 family arsenosugar biosynthesis glycosyltransferase [Flavobacteriaceae bacterium]|jgi:rSAM/selenodomain-associated transferase 2
MTGVSTNKEGISIIIPIYNEAKQLPDFISILFDTLEGDHQQIIFVDGGSKDESCKIIQANPNCHLLHSKKGRAIQMNTGAKEAHYALLYFIHVDCIPPKGFDQILLHQFKEGRKAGCFQMQFDHNHLALNWSAYATKYNARFCRSGDQSLFVEKNLFDQLAGFDERYHICEDVEFIDRLYQFNEFTVLKQKITTSARRFKENGIWRLHFHHGLIHLMRYFGIGPNRLYQYYLRFVK